MNKITFDEMLRANDLPPVGEIVTTPAGDKVEIVGYSYIDGLVVLATLDGHGFEWLPEQARLCSWEGRV